MQPVIFGVTGAPWSSTIGRVGTGSWSLCNPGFAALLNFGQLLDRLFVTVRSWASCFWDCHWCLRPSWQIWFCFDDGNLDFGASFATIDVTAASIMSLYGFAGGSLWSCFGKMHGRLTGGCRRACYCLWLSSLWLWWSYLRIQHRYYHLYCCTKSIKSTPCSVAQHTLAWQESPSVSPFATRRLLGLRLYPAVLAWPWSLAVGWPYQRPLVSLYSTADFC